ncbi:MAG: ABC transporter ATP-binding protein [Xanthobacteraceae bacterium]
MDELLVLSEVTAGYADTVVLEQVSLSVGWNTALAILGRNGVGKSTLLATIMGLTDLRSGSIELEDRSLTRLAVHERPRAGIGYVPQEREIFTSLTVAENLMVAQQPGDWNSSRIYELFPRLAERRRHKGNELSGGEQQMLAIGRALVTNPNLLLLDEPLEGLAPIIIDTLAQSLLDLRRTSGMAMILVEQQTELALEITDHAIVLDRGQVVWRSDSAALRSDRERLDRLIGLKE